MFPEYFSTGIRFCHWLGSFRVATKQQATMLIWHPLTHQPFPCILLRCLSSSNTPHSLPLVFQPCLWSCMSIPWPFYHSELLVWVSFTIDQWFSVMVLHQNHPGEFWKMLILIPYVKTVQFLSLELDPDVIVFFFNVPSMITRKLSLKVTGPWCYDPDPMTLWLLLYPLALLWSFLLCAVCA